MNKLNRVYPGVCSGAVLFLAALTALAQNTETPPGQMSEGQRRALECGSLTNQTGPWDYRTRETTSRLSWDHNDNMIHHYDPAIRRMRAGEYTQPVIADLDFLLRVWPNHHAGLQALMQYERGGGRIYGYRTVECYFERARRFAPDDVAVALMEGQYYFRNKQIERARRSYEDAVKLQPDSADVHYNVGLFYTQTGEYDKALQHAHRAYAAGYPLPGLRSRLERAGHWRDPPSAQEPAHNDSQDAAPDPRRLSQGPSVQPDQSVSPEK